MSVVVRGMKMPKNCFLCPLSVLVGERLVCEVTRDEVLRWKIDFNCPLVELPPHGRLIDADALMENVKTVDYIYRKVVRWLIDHASTIIEAEAEDD